MKAAIMQPYFFPYLGYFSLIKHTDNFVLFDPVQYIRKGWINRNRILKPGEGWQYIIAPVQTHNRDTKIKDILVVEGNEWKHKILRQFDHYKKRAPYYSEVVQLLEDCFSSEELSLTRLNNLYLSKVCSYLDIPFNCSIYSEMDIFVDDTVHAPDEWALRISEKIGATAYINPPGGKEFFSRAKYEQANISLSFLEVTLEEYDQKRAGFEAGLSMLDVLMFNSPETVNRYLDNYALT